MLFYPNAKINLGLNVLRKRPDGYHDIETLFVPVPELCDVLELLYSDKFVMNVYNADIEGTNLCEKAYRLMAERYDIPPIRINLYKNIPMGAGLGGGSADAAFTLVGLNMMLKMGLSDAELASMAAELGSDCPFFIYNRPMMARGRGEILTPVDFSIDGYRLLIEPQNIFVSTKEAYAGIVPSIPDKSIMDIVRRPIYEWKDLLVNDFEKTVFAQHPQLAKAKRDLYEQGALYAAMSGSGSALFAIF